MSVFRRISNWLAELGIVEGAIFAVIGLATVAMMMLEVLPGPDLAPGLFAIALMAAAFGLAIVALHTLAWALDKVIDGGPNAHSH